MQHPPGLVVPVRIDPTGTSGPTRGQARGPRWRRTSHGFYVPAAVDGQDVDQRILEASVVLPPNGAITGWAALRWWERSCGPVTGRTSRHTWFDGRNAAGDVLPITVLVNSHDIRPQPGIVPTGEGTHLIECVDGVRVTTPAWSVVFLMRYAPTPRRAVVALDMAAYSDLVSIAEAAEVISHQSSWTGIPRARRALRFASENSWSPAETLMALAWRIDSGLGAPEANVPVFDTCGRHIGTPDLLDEVAGVAGEYNGPHHLGPVRRLADVNREEVFRSHGLEVVTQMAGDRTEDFLRRLGGAYERAAARRTPRSWTTTPPPWWTSTRTVEQRRALDDEQRRRLLRYRAA